VQNGLAYLILGTGGCALAWRITTLALRSFLIHMPVIPAPARRSELVAYLPRRQRTLPVDVGEVEDCPSIVLTIQRLMQALGAYSFLVWVSGMRVLKHVPAAINSLHALVSGAARPGELDQF